MIIWKKICVLIILILSLGFVGIGSFNIVENKIIVKEYGKLDDGVFDEKDPQKITKKLGRYNGYVAVFFYKEVDRTNLNSNEDTNTIYFYNSIGQFYLYKDRKFYNFMDLQAKSLISVRDAYLIESRFDNYRYNQFILYGKEMWG